MQSFRFFLGPVAKGSTPGRTGFKAEGIPKVGSATLLKTPTPPIGVSGAHIPAEAKNQAVPRAGEGPGSARKATIRNLFGEALKSRRESGEPLAESAFPRPSLLGVNFHSGPVQKWGLSWRPGSNAKKQKRAPAREPGKKRVHGLNLLPSARGPSFSGLQLVFEPENLSRDPSLHFPVEGSFEEVTFNPPPPPVFEGLGWGRISDLQLTLSF